MLRDDILTAAREVGPHVGPFVELQPVPAECLVATMLASFVDRPKRTWWWEGFTQPYASISSPDDLPAFLLRVVPDSNEDLFLLATPDDGPGISVFQGNIRTIAATIANCYCFEFVVLHPSFEWLICESHHNAIYAVGEPVRTRLTQSFG